MSKAEIVCTLPDDAEADAYHGEREQPLIPMKGRSSLVARGAAPVLAPLEAGFGSISTPPGAAGARTRAPQVPKLSGFKLPKRSVEYIAVDW